MHLAAHPDSVDSLSVAPDFAEDGFAVVDDSVVHPAADVAAD